jgi:hypothetical protein
MRGRTPQRTPGRDERFVMRSSSSVDCPQNGTADIRLYLTKSDRRTGDDSGVAETHSAVAEPRLVGRWLIYATRGLLQCIILIWQSPSRGSWPAHVSAPFTEIGFLTRSSVCGHIPPSRSRPFVSAETWRMEPLWNRASGACNRVALVEPGMLLRSGGPHRIQSAPTRAPGWAARLRLR